MPRHDGQRTPTPETLIETLRRVQNGQTVVPPDLLTELVDDLVSCRLVTRRRSETAR